MKQCFFLPIAAFALWLTGCGCSAAESSSADSIVSDEMTTTTTEATQSQAETTATSPMGSINPLTGETGFPAHAVGKRPVAVMVNNVTVSLPQYGIAAADVLYEIPVEAGITRLMALYADYSAVPDVCSVRSCRYYYPLIAYGHDAIYCHWGTDRTIAADTLERLHIDRLDGAGNGWLKCFFRDEERRKVYAVEHTGYLDGSSLPEVIADMGFRTEKKPEAAFSFYPPHELHSEGEPCSAAVLHFSSHYASAFVYDAAAGVYLKSHNGKPHMDSHTQTQLAFANVLILQTEISPREDGYLMDVALEGGSGFYLSAGAKLPLIWKKSADDAPIELFRTNGDVLALNVGKSYIGILDTDRMIDWN